MAYGSTSYGGGAGAQTSTGALVAGPRMTIGMYGEMFLADHLVGGDALPVAVAGGGGTGTIWSLAALPAGIATVTASQINRVRKMAASPVCTAAVSARFILALALKGTTSFQADNYESGALVNSPWLYWKLNELTGTTANDSSGNGRSGGITNAVLNQPGAHGSSTAFFFDGSGDSVQCGTTPTFTSTFSYAIWVKPTTTTTSASQASSGVQGFPANGTRWAVYPTHEGADAGSGLAVGTNQIAVFEHGNAYLAPVVVVNGTFTGWTHVLVVYNGSPTSSNNTKVYVNGVLAGQGNGSRSTVYPPFIIGVGPYGDYQGYLDDFSLYSTALTSTQATALYASSASSPTGATVTGSVTYLIIGLNAAPAGIASVTANILRLKRIAASIAGAGAVTGALKLDAIRVRASATGTATVTGRLAKTDALTAAPAGSATVSGSALKLTTMSGSISTSSTTSGSMTRSVLHASTAAGSATVTAARPNLVRRLTVAPSGSSSVSGRISSRVPMSSSVSGSASVSGNLIKPRYIQGSSTGTATVTGALTRHLLNGTSNGSASCFGATATGIVYMRGAPTGTSSVTARYRIALHLLTGGASGSATVTGSAKRVYLIYSSGSTGTSSCSASVRRLKLLRSQVTRRFYKDVYDTFTRADSTNPGTPEVGGPYLPGLFSRTYFDNELNQTIAYYAFDSAKRNYGTGKPYVQSNQLRLPVINDTHMHYGTGRIARAGQALGTQVQVSLENRRGTTYYLILAYYEADGGVPSFYYVKVDCESSASNVVRVTAGHEGTGGDIGYANLDGTPLIQYNTFFTDAEQGEMMDFKANLDTRGYLTVFRNDRYFQSWKIGADGLAEHIYKTAFKTYQSDPVYFGVSAVPPSTGTYTNPTSNITYPVVVRDAVIDNLQISPLRDQDPNLTGAAVTGNLVLDAYRLRAKVVGHSRPVALLNSPPGTRSWEYKNLILQDQPVAYWRMDDTRGVFDVMSDPANYAVPTGGDDLVLDPAVLDNENNESWRIYLRQAELGQPSKLFGSAPAGWSFSGWIDAPVRPSTSRVLYAGGPRISLSYPFNDTVLDLAEGHGLTPGDGVTGWYDTPYGDWWERTYSQSSAGTKSSEVITKTVNLPNVSEAVNLVFSGGINMTTGTFTSGYAQITLYSDSTHYSVYRVNLAGGLDVTETTELSVGLSSPTSVGPGGAVVLGPLSQVDTQYFVTTPAAASFLIKARGVFADDGRYADGAEIYSKMAVVTDIPLRTFRGEDIYARYIRVIHSNSTIEFGQERVHLGVSYDGTTRRIYVNGVLTDTFVDGVPMFFQANNDYYGTPEPTGIGVSAGEWYPLNRLDVGTPSPRYAGTDPWPVASRVDEFAVFHKVLTDVEFAQHYEMGLGLRTQMVALSKGTSTVTEHFGVHIDSLSATSNGSAVTEYIPLRPLAGSSSGQASVSGSFYMNKLNLRSNTASFENPTTHVVTPPRRPEGSSTVTGAFRQNRPIVGTDQIIGNSTVQVFFRVYPRDFDTSGISSTANVVANLEHRTSLRATSAGVGTAKHTPFVDVISGTSFVFARLRSGTGGNSSGSSRVRGQFVERLILRATSNGFAVAIGTRFSPKYEGTAAGVALVQTAPYPPGFSGPSAIRLSRHLRGAIAGSSQLNTQSHDRLNRPVITPFGTVLMGVRIRGDLGDADIVQCSATVSASMMVIYRKTLVVPGDVSLRRAYALDYYGDAAKSTQVIQPTTPTADSDEGGPPIKVRKSRHLFV